MDVVEVWRCECFVVVMEFAMQITESWHFF
jgi:hypothetical protein